jgi:glutaredoxin 3
VKKLVIIAALVLGAIVCVRYMTPSAQAAKTVTSTAMPAIELYSASYCGECARAKAYMKRKGIQFVDYDIENDIDKRREFYARGGVAIPLFFIHGEKMEGFDAQRFEFLRAGDS